MMATKGCALSPSLCFSPLPCVTSPRKADAPGSGWEFMHILLVTSHSSASEPSRLRKEKTGLGTFSTLVFFSACVLSFDRKDSGVLQIGSWGEGGQPRGMAPEPVALAPSKTRSAHGREEGAPLTSRRPTSYFLRLGKQRRIKEK